MHIEIFNDLTNITLLILIHVMIIKTTFREINDVERILENIFKETHYGSREHDFGCVHYLWPTTNIHLPQLQKLKAEIEKEVSGTRFVYFEPIVPRKNMTFSIFGNFQGIGKAK